VEHRAKFYEATGALRDMVPNHVFQLLAMVAMEPPGGFDARSVRNRKADVFATMAPLTEEDAVRGQYGPGAVLDQPAAAYHEEPGVARGSNTETYVALRLKIDNWRWAGVPFYLRTGKRMSRRYSEIAIRFKHAPYAPFEDTHVDELPPNWLVIRIQPNEGISLQFEVKRPGPAVDLAAVQMDFSYRDWFPREPNVGYETLIYDCMIGDQTLFQRADMVEETWRIVQPVLDAWAASPPSHFPNYAAGAMARAQQMHCCSGMGARGDRSADRLRRGKTNLLTPSWRACPGKCRNCKSDFGQARADYTRLSPLRPNSSFPPAEAAGAVCVIPDAAAGPDTDR